jgi:pimeloyl-ACP methyl ester carboxylesterase
MMARAFAPPQRDTTDTPGSLGLPGEQVWLESVNGTRLHGWFIPVDGDAPAVVVLHGWGGNASLMLPLAPYLHRAGFHALFLDARNHGISEHDSFASMPRFAEDLEVAADWLRVHRHVTSLGVIGHSVGAGAAILSASRSGRFQAVVAVSSFAHPGEMMREQMKSIPRIALTLILGFMQRLIGHQFDEFAPRNRIPLVSAPVMLVHGDADPVVPIDNLHELAAAHPGAELLVVPEGGHSDLAPFEPYVGDITSFLDRHLRL